FSLKTSNLSAGGRVPHADRVARLLSRSDQGPVRREGDAKHGIAAFQSLQFLAGSHPPQDDLALLAAGSEDRAGSGKGQRVDTLLVPREGVDLLPGGRIPETNLAVAAAGSQHLAAGRIGDAPQAGVAKAQRADAGQCPLRQGVAAFVEPFGGLL